MNVTMIDLFILFLAAFRLTRLLVFDRITEPFRRPFFTELKEVSETGEVEIWVVPKENGIKGFIGQLLSCYWCTGVWASAICCILYVAFQWVGGIILLILAVAGAASFIELIVQRLLNDE
ncbi:hypothetical protein JOC78_000443 [Bacillus ectoiniformans]|uniref:DUF1360 domain-containing protein n=1 Tax=Bacillus ectoiniformans TaxID=1494429 RepID=UPI00195B3BDB|nr:DUF1360 domain-containing protein [Bacillus ectoiniformans]MBM7647522.1 hypothetical protein [Bacillus ectoiniformans]